MYQNKGRDSQPRIFGGETSIPAANSHRERSRVVIIGAGFAGITAVQRLGSQNLPGCEMLAETAGRSNGRPQAGAQKMVTEEYAQISKMN